MLFLRSIPALLLCATLAMAAPASEPTGMPQDLSAPAVTPAAAELRAVAGQVEETLRKQDLDLWFPRCVDMKRGGFLPNFDRQWRPGADQPKTLVFQSRMTWVTSEVVRRRPDLAPRFREIAKHGADFLRDRMWDARDGGFFWELGPKDEAPEDPAKQKHVYGISFAIYALATEGAALGDQPSIQRASEAFLWLDAHAHDDKNGGYYEALYRDGHPMLAAPPGKPPQPRDMIWTPMGLKSMNTHIHLLESFTTLYGVWPDPRLRTRLEELLGLMENRVYVWPGVQNMFFTPDWKPVPVGMSYGHDVETAYLMVEAATALGRPDDPEVWRDGRALVDHALGFGWDAKNGGFYDTGNALEGPTNSHQKTWWVQAECLNTLLLMHERFGGETGIYWKRFLQVWKFIQRHQIDSTYGGWYSFVNEDGSQFVGNGAKGNPWKAAYHTGRAMMNVADRLNRLAAPPAQKP